MNKTMLLGLAVILTACSGAEYSDETKNGFLRSCTASGRSTPLFCSCALDELQKEYNEQEFLAMDNEMKATQRLPERLLQSMVPINQKCKKS
ncbi:hypothetical protein [Vogesella sp. AC12]|uniref:hypothetical protein n=1 Tax=Vogesella sp. AC12 TaxID=2950550 RepID=UPI00210AA5ED|nr:hypothetical protein [Vogesella sp. AC12]MCQ4143357.1 hypothetical protein [Vogesella sp. AC12]